MRNCVTVTFPLIVILGLLYHVHGDGGFTRKPGNVAVMVGKRLTLIWRVSIPDDQILACFWQHRRSSADSWTRFVGFTNTNKQRQNTSKTHVGWEFLSPSEACKDGIWRDNISEGYTGMFQFIIYNLQNEDYVEYANVTVVRPADLKYSISINGTVIESDLSGDPPDLKTINLTQNQSLPVNVSVTWPENSINSITINEQKQHVKCQRDSNQPVPYTCVADVGLYNKNNTASQLIVNIKSSIEGAESVIIHQTIERTLPTPVVPVGVITKQQYAAKQKLATAFIILFVVAVLIIISMLLYWLLKIRKAKTYKYIADIHELEEANRKLIVNMSELQQEKYDEIKLLKQANDKDLQILKDDLKELTDKYEICKKEVQDRVDTLEGARFDQLAKDEDNRKLRTQLKEKDERIDLLVKEINQKNRHEDSRKPYMNREINSLKADHEGEIKRLKAVHNVAINRLKTELSKRDSVGTRDGNAASVTGDNTSISDATSPTPTDQFQGLNRNQENIFDEAEGAASKIRGHVEDCDAIMSEFDEESLISEAEVLHQDIINTREAYNNKIAGMPKSTPEYKKISNARSSLLCIEIDVGNLLNELRKRELMNMKETLELYFYGLTTPRSQFYEGSLGVEQACSKLKIAIRSAGSDTGKNRKIEKIKKSMSNYVERLDSCNNKFEREKSSCAQYMGYGSTDVDTAGNVHHSNPRTESSSASTRAQWK